ncbi:hypothetical protein CALCODRAFT_1551 [Calocera cornea HHB12733]|uniref:Uncharacterized protein n=1 Tax=Calocera cornea HHB12733 TaxID=1353952 RepID=A0A165K805_9BASI|nr:hypothetical protein CALCODRAFT_1551 [Calocera cornea HHB12733]
MLLGWKSGTVHRRRRVMGARSRWLHDNSELVIVQAGGRRAPSLTCRDNPGTGRPSLAAKYATTTGAGCAHCLPISNNLNAGLVSPSWRQTAVVAALLMSHPHALCHKCDGDWSTGTATEVCDPLANNPGPVQHEYTYTYVKHKRAGETIPTLLLAAIRP